MIKSVKVLSGFASQLRALKDRTFTFTNGVNVLFGPNGSGKTTLLNIVASNCFIDPKDGGVSKFPPPLFWSGYKDDLKKVPSKYVRDCEANVDWDGTPSVFLRANNEVKGYFEDDNEVIPLGDQLNRCMGSFSDGQWKAKTLKNAVDQAKKLPDLTAKPSRYDNLNDTWRKCHDIFTDYIKSLPRDGKPTLLLDEPDRGFSVDTQALFWTKVVQHIAKDFQVIVSSNSPFSLVFDVISFGDENYAEDARKDMVRLAERFGRTTDETKEDIRPEAKEPKGGWSVYIVRTQRGHLYTGSTKNVERRVKQHNNGTGAKSLRGQLPVELVWSKDGMERGEALRLEAKIKTWTAKEKELLVKGENNGRL